MLVPNSYLNSYSIGQKYIFNYSYNFYFSNMIYIINNYNNMKLDESKFNNDINI